MSGNFENIFEKYNINCDKKRQKNSFALTNSHTFPKNQMYLDKGSIIHRNSTNLISSFSKEWQSLNFNNSCYFNTNMKGKYYSPTRYKTLDTVPVVPAQKVHNQFNLSIRGSSPFNEQVNGDGESYGKENYNGEIDANSEDKACRKVAMQLEYPITLSINEIGTIDDSLANACTYSTGGKSSSIKSCLLDSFNISKSYKIYKKEASNKCLRYKQLDVMTTHKLKNLNASLENQTNLKCRLNISDNFPTESLQPFENNVIQHSEAKDSNALTKQPVESTSCELDLLIALIAREERNKKLEDHRQNEKFFNCDDNLPRTKTYLKGGLQQLFQRTLKQEKVTSHFLKYDKKIGLRLGQLLTVVNIETSYGLTLATVKSENLNKNFGIVLTEEMTQRLKKGHQIEAFFDDKSLPYKLQLHGECIDVYLEPYKLLIV